MPHAEQRISAIIDPYLMFIENIAVSHSRRIYLNSRRLIVVLETCRYVKRYINAFVKIALSYRSLNENLTTLLKKGDKWALPGRLPEVISKKKKFTCTVQRKTTLTWLKKILFSVFWIKRKINVLLSNIIHLLKRKRQSNNTQQWTIDKMTVFCASVHRLIQTGLLFLWQSPAIGVCFLSDLLCGFFFIIVSILIHKSIINSPTQIRLKSRNEGKRL